MSTRRYVRLGAGLALFGASIALMVRAGLGLDSWDVLHQGLAERTGLPLGLIINGTALLVLLAWIPLRQRPGIGTIANVALVGLAAQVSLAVLPTPHHLAVRVGLLAAAIVLNAFATALYIGAGLGPGPRDGLMTGLAARGHSIRAVRTAIELAVLALGWLLGGTVGAGTLLYAVSIGPLVQFFLTKIGAPHAHSQRDPGQHPTRPGRRADRALVRTDRA
ncbi:YitT family protein [Nonomuraea sp. NPDC050536]|uniref:membrane protein YczE n=1 Tax=Nonomuraea sp. NPDC050536 TaxID=3364366 RepID=UPI0037C9CDA5